MQSDGLGGRQGLAVSFVHFIWLPRRRSLNHRSTVEIPLRSHWDPLDGSLARSSFQLRTSLQVRLQRSGLGRTCRWNLFMNCWVFMSFPVLMILDILGTCVPGFCTTSSSTSFHATRGWMGWYFIQVQQWGAKDPTLFSWLAMCCCDPSGRQERGAKMEPTAKLGWSNPKQLRKELTFTPSNFFKPRTIATFASGRSLCQTPATHAQHAAVASQSTQGGGNLVNICRILKQLEFNCNCWCEHFWMDGKLWRDQIAVLHVRVTESHHLPANASRFCCWTTQESTSASCEEGGAVSQGLRCPGH